MSKKAKPTTDQRIIELVSEINQLREENVRYKAHSVALNEVCWYLATELGDIGPHNQLQLEIIPMDLARRAMKRG